MRQTRDAGLITEPNPSWMIDKGAYQLLLRRPAVNIEDDHFDEQTLASKWLPWSGSQNPSLIARPGWLSIIQMGYCQPIPAGDWTIETETILPSLVGGYANASLILSNSSNASSSTMARFYCGDAGRLNATMICLDKIVNNGWNLRYIAEAGATFIPDRIFMRITKVGTTYYFRYNFSPFGNFNHFGSIAASTLGFTPTYFGLYGQGGPVYFNYFLRF
jgi:hypothetical protein